NDSKECFLQRKWQRLDLIDEQRVMRLDRIEERKEFGQLQIGPSNQHMNRSSKKPGERVGQITLAVAAGSGEQGWGKRSAVCLCPFCNRAQGTDHLALAQKPIPIRNRPAHARTSALSSR